MTGLTHRVLLSRDHDVRIDGNDYSVDPRCIGRFVHHVEVRTLAGKSVRTRARRELLAKGRDKTDSGPPEPV